MILLDKGGCLFTKPELAEEQDSRRLPPIDGRASTFRLARLLSSTVSIVQARIPVRFPACVP